MNGFCHIVIMGNQYRSELLFQQHAQMIKTNLLKREPFLSRASELIFHFVNSSQNLRIGNTGGFESALIPPDTKKIKREFAKAGVENMNALHILDFKIAGGGALGNVSITGLNSLIDTHEGDVNYCSHNLITRATDGICIHEIGHSMGIGAHVTNEDNVMNTATNGGCFLVNKPFTAAHQTIINTFIDNSKNIIL